MAAGLDFCPRTRRDEKRRRGTPQLLVVGGCDGWPLASRVVLDAPLSLREMIAHVVRRDLIAQRSVVTRRERSDRAADSIVGDVVRVGRRSRSDVEQRREARRRDSLFYCRTIAELPTE